MGNEKQITRELERRARAYIEVRRKQELNHTDEALNHRRAELHDALMMQLDIEGIDYEDREDAARIAQDIVDGEYEIAEERDTDEELDAICEELAEGFIPDDDTAERGLPTD
jgi:hypothetical protein